MNTEMLNALKEKAHMWAMGHGFYDEVKPDAFYLGLVMSEAGEAINADQNGRHADTKRFEEVMAMRCISPRVAFEGNIKDTDRLPYEMSFQPLIRFHKRGRPRKTSGRNGDAASVKLPTQRDGDATRQSEDAARQSGDAQEQSED